MSTIRVPLLGRISTGLPLPVPPSDFLLAEDEQWVDVSAELLPREAAKADLFALQAQGTGMLEAGIADGDVAVLQATQQAKDGETVAVFLPDRSEAALTRLWREGGGYRLEAANAALRPVLIPAGQPLEVKGKLVLVIRAVPG